MNNPFFFFFFSEVEPQLFVPSFTARCRVDIPEFPTSHTNTRLRGAALFPEDCKAGRKRNPELLSNKTRSEIAWAEPQLSQFLWTQPIQTPTNLHFFTQTRILISFPCPSHHHSRPTSREVARMCSNFHDKLNVKVGVRDSFKFWGLEAVFV